MICAVPNVIIVGPQDRSVQAVSTPWNDGSRCTTSENFALANLHKRSRLYFFLSRVKRVKIV